VGLSHTATAGTKRIGKLMRSRKWSAVPSERFLLEEANTEVERLKAHGKRILCLFDGSVIEKPESSKLEATGPVLSRKAKRLTRSRLGLLFTLPTLRPLGVRGMDWTGTMITGLEGIPTLAVMRWWTTKGEYAEKLREKEEEVLRVLVRTWGPLLTFVFDRGEASGPWRHVLERFRVRFIIGWIKKHVCYDQEGREKNLWEMGRGKRYLAHKLIRESTSGLKLACDLWWTPVRHPHSPQHRYLVKARLKGHVCYLIPPERVQTEEIAGDGAAGLCLFVASFRGGVYRSCASALALEMPSHRQAVSRSSCPAVPASLGAQSSVG
jgi:hypothetical protein